MAQTAKNAVHSKPKAGGAVWSGATDATLPTDAAAELDSGFSAWGYISEAGVKENNSPSVTTKKAYGGSTVLTIEAGNDVTYTLTPLEYVNPTVQRELYGTSNVSDSTGTLTEVKVTDDGHPTRAFVFEHVLSNGMVERDVLPCAQVTSIGTNTYSSGDALGPEVTVTPYPDSAGVKVYKYFAKAGE